MALFTIDMAILTQFGRKRNNFANYYLTNGEDHHNYLQTSIIILILRSLHVPFAVLYATTIGIKAQDEDVVPFSSERGAILLKITAPAVRHGTVTLNQKWFIVAIICTRCIRLFQPRGHNSITTTYRR